MVKEKNLALMGDIMGIVTQADEWQDIQMNDPKIAVTRERWRAVLERVKDTLPWKLYDDLIEANAAVVAAISDAGILLGIHVADAIRDVASRSADLSRYVLNRIEEERA